MPPNDQTDRAKYEPVARAAAKAYGIDESFFISLLTHENDTWDPTRPSFDHYPDGRPKSIGIGQITEETARALGIDPTKRSDPYTAIPAAAKLVSGLSKKYDGDWWKMYAAYNAGDAPVDRAVQQAANANPLLGKDWRTYFTKEAPAYQTTISTASSIIDTALHGGAGVPEIKDFATAAQQKYGAASANVKPSDNGPPDLNDDRYLIQGENGQYTRDATTWAKDQLTWYSGQKIKRDLEEGPKAQYYDDIIKEISANIASGGYSLSKAKLELDTRKGVYDTVVSNAANLLQYAVPAGSQYYPGGEPGGFYDKMGVAPSHPQTMPVDLFGEAAGINAQAKSSMAGMPNVSADPATQAFNQLYPDRPISRPQPGGGGSNLSGPLANSAGGVQWANPFESAQNIVNQSLPQAPAQMPDNLFSSALDMLKQGLPGFGR